MPRKTAKTASAKSPHAAARPVVVIVGRPNVGKSTLFNRLSRTRRALMSDIPGTTRDWIEGTVHWGDRAFQVIDTGGYAPGDDDVMTGVRAQVERWVRTADVVIWLLDAVEGLTPADSAIGRWIRPLARRVFVVPNKVDDRKQETQAPEFYRLGYPDVIGISASHGRNVNGLLDALTAAFPPAEGGEAEDEGLARVAIVGRPNVGKSSLTNRLLGEDRMIVSAVPGTTRDTVDSPFSWGDKRFLLMDTAGLRAKKSKADALEGLTRIMSEKALDRCDVALLLLDGSEGILEGDTAVARLIEARARACVVGINKWDAVAGQERLTAAQWFRARQPADMPFLDYCPIVFISAKDGTNLDKLLEAVWDAHVQYRREWDKEELTAFFWRQVQERPYSYHGRKLVFKSAEQVDSAPPTILFRSNLTPEQVHFSYQRRLENLFREKYGVMSTPVVFRFRRGS